jgi:hypothetical protein
MFWFFFSQKKIFKLFFVQQNNLEYVKQQNHLPNMTRNNSAVVTQLIRDQYEHLRTKMQKQLANQVLSIVGIRYYQELPYVTTNDIFAQEEALLELLGLVRAWFPAIERQRLYKNNEHLGMSVAKLLLGAVGHSLKRTACRLDADTTCNKFSLDPALLAANLQS